MHRALRRWMNEAEDACVKSLMAEHFSDGSNERIARRASVERVPEHRRADSFGEVHANLMRATRFEPALDVRRSRESCEDPNMRDGVPAFFHTRRHFEPIFWVSRVQRLDAALARNADDDRFVCALDRVCGKLRAQRLACLGVARDDHHTRSSAIEPMHDAGPHVFTLARKQTAREQSRHERSLGEARRRMHDDARGLHDNDDIVIGVEHFERNARVGRDFGRRRRERLDVQNRSVANAIFCTKCPIFQRYAARVDPTLRLRARAMHFARDKHIHPKTARRRGNDDLHQSFDFTCPLALMRMSTIARS